VKYGLNITSFGGTYDLHIQGVRVNRDGRMTVKYGCKCKEMAPQIMQCLGVGTRRGRGRGKGREEVLIHRESGKKKPLKGKKGNVEGKSGTASQINTIFRDGTVATSHCNYSSLRYKYGRISGSDTLRALPILFNLIILRV